MPVHLAQINVAKLLAPIDDPKIADFVTGLGPVNALAEAAPGFIWRLVGEGNDATSLRPFPDPEIIVNMSVWESVETLKAFVYRGNHAQMFRRRSEWFHTPTVPMTTLWWVHADELPTLDDARRRLDFLVANGPTPYAFTAGTVKPTLTIDATNLDDPAAAALIEALNAELLARTPQGGRNFFRLATAEVTEGTGTFLVAHLDGEPVGCGAIRLIANATAEIKRMYVSPQGRGHRIGAAMLSELEAHARRLGATQAVLETGPYLTEAVALYRRAGFSEIPCWGDYAGLDHNLCMAKELA